ncbi:anti-phage dCTP deaminase [Roseateles sp. L2-2]|uniref:anti-phage dCTP deaminase n=1 Tax=Roseateles sp. L2-2 TaxID=3422597 RepID=UPI003D35AA71
MSQKLNAHPVPGENARHRMLADHSSASLIAATQTEELVIALCGPIGTPLRGVAETIAEVLQSTFGYATELIRLSDHIKHHALVADIDLPADPVLRLKIVNRVGDEMRQRFGGAVLAELAVRQIRQSRDLNGRSALSQTFVPRRVCHLIDSIKNQQELDLLRTVYREVLYVVGVYSPLPYRDTALRLEGLDDADISELMDRESGKELAGGQSVDGTFPQCDFFLRVDTDTSVQIRHHIERFLHLILGTRVVTPTRAEAAMHAASAAATRSACLSRQVGAAVTDADGDVLAVGWNDVPKAFGGLYMTDLAGDPHGLSDRRCWTHGAKCHNDEEKDVLSTQLLEALTPFIERDQRAAAAEVVFKHQKLRSLLEFSRAIHAEMHALLGALRHGGDRVRGGKLFVTTYPCHACARHIVAAGVKEVYFIEPYRKSLATHLHGDAVTEDEQAVDKVRFIPFDGVAPTRYLHLFRVNPGSRKKGGQLVTVAPKSAGPRARRSLEALPALESLVIESLRRRSVVDVDMPTDQPPGNHDHEDTTSNAS